MNLKLMGMVAMLLALVACNGPLSDEDMDAVFGNTDTTLVSLRNNEPAPYVSQCWPIVNTSVDVSFCTKKGRVPLECKNGAASYMIEEGVTECGILYDSTTVPLDVDDQIDNLICCKKAQGT